MGVEAGQRDDYIKQLAAAVLVGGVTGIATLLSGRLSIDISAAVTALASLVGWLIGRIITHQAHRYLNAFLVIVLTGVSVALVVVGRKQCAPKGVMCLVGGCSPFGVYAQNRYLPYGAAIRAEPRREATQVGSYQPNQIVSVDGWVRTASAYPHNTPPFNNDVWFHVSDGSGWISFAGVRADPTIPAEDPTDSNGGAPAPTPPECQGTFKTNT